MSYITPLEPVGVVVEEGVKHFLLFIAELDPAYGGEHVKFVEPPLDIGKPGRFDQLRIAQRVALAFGRIVYGRNRAVDFVQQHGHHAAFALHLKLELAADRVKIPVVHHRAAFCHVIAHGRIAFRERGNIVGVEYARIVCAGGR
jgi:hypothetical protein